MENNLMGFVTPKLTRTTVTTKRSDIDNGNNSNSSRSEEEHFEFSPELIDNHDNQEQRAKLPKNLSTDSFRSTSSASSLGNNGFQRNNQLRQSFNQRNSWARSSLRRTGSSSSSQNNGQSSNANSDSKNGHLARRLSANAHASQMFRGSPNGTSPGSRRSSMSPDELETESIFLEDDVMDLTQKIDNLQQQVTFLHESQSTNDDRYSKVKQENASLLSKIHTLEEQLRDIEVQSDDRRKDEEKRFKDAISRTEREKSFEVEQYIGRVYALQQELLEARDETRRTQAQLERKSSEKFEVESLLREKADELELLRDEVERLQEHSKRRRDEEIANVKVINVLNQELEEMRQHDFGHNNKSRHSTSSVHYDDKLVHQLEQELRKLKVENSELKEANEELQATLLTSRLEEGRTLLKDQVASLAQEMGSLTEDQLRQTVKEVQDENSKLRAYIDDMLLNIVENYPQLLEVKSS
ncbi:Rab11 family-interacting protein 4A [Halotydeus destructor]|nr:Rab11 family-interacting protein 4A [Halotydeus destructor]